MTFEQFQQTRYFSALDGLRAFSVLWVVLHHCPKIDLPFLSRLQEAGLYGVELFFVISGFLITTLILRERPLPLGRRLRAFYARRALRIFPAYYLAFAAYWVLSWLSSPHPKRAAFFDYQSSLLFYYFDWAYAFGTDVLPYFGHAWSLAIEEKFYLLWPLIAMALVPRRAAAVAVAAVAVIWAWKVGLVLSYEGDLFRRLYFAFDTRVDGILVGAVAAFLLRRESTFSVCAALFGRRSMAWLWVGLFFVATVGFSRVVWVQFFLAPVLATAIVAALVIEPRALVPSYFGNRSVRYLGEISYGIYLFHPMAVGFALLGLGRVGLSGPLSGTLLGFGLSILLAHLSYRLFESRFLELKVRFAG